ncbi:MAG: alpha-amylase family protein [Acidimicrobiia bacterium]
MDLRGSERRNRARDWWRDARPGVLADAVDRLGDADGQAFAVRVDVVVDELHAAVAEVYEPLGHDADGLVERLVELALSSAEQRPVALRRLDHRREIDPQWFLRARQIGYVAYTDRFAGTLRGVLDRLDHLDELGVTYLHLMPLLRAREGENDGGYAVADHDQVEPSLGTMDDLADLAAALHDRDMALCIDLVVNHTAAEHPWAEAARAGDAHHRAFYRIFPDRTEPDRYEQTLREVFPEMAPGSFTEVPGLGWVWTTFREWQWDLDYGNPDVLAAMAGVMGRLANRGVDVFRLDAVPFLWKRVGTDCENLPEAHRVVQILRNVLRISAPGAVCKAEAIVPPEELVQYLGGHRPEVRECELAYHNQLMVMLWSSLAARDARLMTRSLSRMRRPPDGTGWVTYVRCHDDIGWAVSDADAAAVGWNGFEHRAFLNRFYAGEHPGSWARGVRFQEDPVTLDARISGTAAALAGIDDARERGDAAALDAGIRRHLLLHAVIIGWGGSIPLLYMGDEIALANDWSFADDPARADDNRWIHRPPMDWDAAARRHDPASVEGRVFAKLREQVLARRDLPVMRAGGTTDPVATGHGSVFAWRRSHPRHLPFLGVAAFSDDPVSIPLSVAHDAGLAHAGVVLASDPGVRGADGRIELPAWGWVWLSD